MFNLFKRKQKPRDPIPAWVKWVVLVFIVYAVATNHHREKPATDHAAPADAVGLTKQKFSDYRNMLMPGLSLRVEDTATGNGHPVFCGQDIRIAYSAFLGDDKTAIDTADAYRFRIGAGETMPALEQGVTGMLVGGKRHVFARNSLAYANGESHKDIPQDAMLRFDVELLAATPDLPDPGAAPYRIADAEAGNGNAVSCGQPTKIMTTVWNTEGKKLFETKQPIIFTPGKSDVFLGLEQGVIGMRVGGIRTLVVPPAFQKPLHGGKPVIAIPLPQSQAVIVDVEVVR